MTSAGWVPHRLRDAGGARCGRSSSIFPAEGVGTLSRVEQYSGDPPSSSPEGSSLLLGGSVETTTLLLRPSSPDGAELIHPSKK